jgi:hypothetical protein
MRIVVIESTRSEVRPWYSQFYLSRGRAEWASGRVSPEGYEAHLECIDGFVYVGTSTYGSSTSVTIEVHDREPPPTLADHVVEVTLGGDGRLALLNWEPGRSTSRTSGSTLGSDDTTGIVDRSAGG